ncbi:hypothetical protein ACHHYP_02945 [Achlya hypogyna]|uniref:EF-hand domain-containing protein n=1 Tax=Achlya hypogyna TaxID=1202772 RepID=A0A1V9Z564_ACHHY|nr:hypothetical protein ACHHYP_02945 [Achlya hypogyna]
MDAYLRAQIRGAFDMFDKDRKGCMQDDEPSTFVTYEKFEKKMLEVMYSHEYEPDSDETLMAAFRVLDPEKKGYIEADTMRELLLTKGTPFREKELEGFLHVAKDAETGKIYYEDYISLLTQEVDSANNKH